MNIINLEGVGVEPPEPPLPTALICNMGSTQKCPVPYSRLLRQLNNFNCY